MAKKSHAISGVEDSSLVLMLIFFTAALFLVNFFVSTINPARFVSSEVQFTDLSASGMALTPASCASNPSYYHQLLRPTADGKGFVSTSTAPTATEFGLMAPYLGIYICIINTSGTAGTRLFVPTLTAAEYNAFKANKPAGVTAY